MPCLEKPSLSPGQRCLTEGPPAAVKCEAASRKLPDSGHQGGREQEPRPENTAVATRHLKLVRSFMNTRQKPLEVTRNN